MDTIDFRKDALYKAKTEPAVIEVPKLLFVMVDGKGAPEASGATETEFQRAMQALFGLVYTIKFWNKKFPAPPGYSKFTMAPVEGLWWMQNGQAFDMATPDEWRWTLMLRVPEFVTQDYFKDVIRECVKAKKSDVYKKGRLEWFEEGPSVQIMHIGPYDQEQPQIDKMHAYALDQGYRLIGKHHELYFGDPRRTAPEKLKTILRHPVTKSQ